ncbi:MAG: PilT/PilU family type 4a pilus ATPase [Planctomycetes bacterium]|nr:PilT/PilU family type 4a pilus ATPase [Planctomycetota bacterium]
MFDLQKTLEMAVAAGASDLILKTGSQPAVKVSGKVLFLSDDVIDREDGDRIVAEVASALVRDRFEKQGEIDFSYQAPRAGRFRVNLFRQGGSIGLVMRQIKNVIPVFEQLKLPQQQFAYLANLDRGIIFVTGVTGSGKSTTLAAIVDFINNTRNKHIITLEDPVEYTFTDNLSIVSQREVGVDTESFATGLRAAMREAPDVIMVGEIRDEETMQAAISAAETGHLVLTTLHTVNAIQTVERVHTFFPPHQHDLVRLQLSTVLAGVASQRLIPNLKDAGMVPAVELLMATPRVRELVFEGKTLELEKALVEGQEYYGTQTFNMSLKRLYEDGLVSLEDALAASDNPDDLKLIIRGIETGTSASRLRI